MIYQALAQRQDEELTAHISYIEIYQEVAYDLLTAGARTLSPVTPFPKVFCISVEYQERRKEMFYLTTHSTHFILRLYGVGHMVKDHSDSERGNPLLPHGLLFPINSKGSFIYTIPQT